MSRGGNDPRKQTRKPRRKKRPGIKVLEDVLGMGEKVERHRYYRMSLRAWLNNRQPVIWTKPFGLLDKSHISEDGKTITVGCRYDRVFLIAGLFYGIEGMRIGGKRVLKISPHLAYRERGVEGMIPPNAVLEVELKIDKELTEF
jgi:FKBP-type peptidyl-prolyl cis-trans isomerase